MYVYMFDKNASCVLISVSDPLLMYIRILNWRNRLQYLFDNLFIAVSPGPTDRDAAELTQVRQYFDQLTQNDPRIKIDYLDIGESNHGVNIRTVLSKNWDQIRDIVLIMEDDDFIVNTDTLQMYMNKIRNGEVDYVGEVRGCTNNNDLLAFERKIGIEDNLVESSLKNDLYCLHYHPTHFLIRKQHLRPDDIFEAHYLPVGSKINMRGREFLVDMDTCMDTFVYFSINLMNRINRGYEHCMYQQSVSEYSDKFAYCFYQGIHHPWLQDGGDFEQMVTTRYHFHIGSATCLLKFGFETSSILTQSMFEEMDNYRHDSDLQYTMIEIYRRYYVYKCAFDTVKDDVEFAPFVKTYNQNFTQAEQYFEKIDFDGILKSKDQVFISKKLYEVVFKHIAGTYSP